MTVHPTVAGVVVCAVLAVAVATAAAAEDLEVSGAVSAEGRFFPHAPIHPDQDDHTGGAFGYVELYKAWEASGDSVTVKPFFRYDAADGRRTHFDLREAVWLKVIDDVGFLGDGPLELRFGVDKVFWGRTESRHLVDVVNQTDLIEYPDEEEKLGQPMLRLTLPRAWGVADIFFLPYFRERTFAGRDGRLRSALVVDTGKPIYESGMKRWHPDVAARYGTFVGPVDFGVAWFHGTSREPGFVPAFDFAGGDFVLRPFYAQIDQASADAQYTEGPWLLKLEALQRWGQLDRYGRENAYFSSVAGFEYTLFGLFESDVDLGLLGEWLYDQRGRRATTPFENDVFVGFRLALNDPQDTSVLAGVIQDTGSPGRTFVLEASRRIGDSWRLDVEGAIVAGPSKKDLLYDQRADDYIQIGWTYYF